MNVEERGRGGCFDVVVFLVSYPLVCCAYVCGLERQFSFGA